jgi:hypothetical protein
MSHVQNSLFFYEYVKSDNLKKKDTSRFICINVSLGVLAITIASKIFTTLLVKFNHLINHMRIKVFELFPDLKQN